MPCIAFARARAAGEMDFAYQEVYGSPLQRGATTSNDLCLASRARCGK